MAAPEPRPQPEVALGRALHARADEIARRVLATWDERCSGSAAFAGERVRDDIVRTTQLATVAVTSYLMRGERQSAEEKRAEAATGKAPLRDTISLSDLTKLYFYWRDTTIEVVREEALRLDLPRSMTDRVIDIVRGGSDGSVVWMVKQFDSERQRLQEELKCEQARLSHEAAHDALTGLPNRKLFFDRLTHALARSARHGFGTAVLFIDIDDFKAVNDHRGHLVGDQLLTAIAARLQERIRAADTVARLGGDEFVVLCEDLVSPSADATVLVERVETAFENPFTLRTQPIRASASIGLAIATSSCDADVLLTRADHAMYRCKQSRHRHDKLAGSSLGGDAAATSTIPRLSDT
jgi:diguanylate cyclase (GGDEF)-like protein